MYFVIKNDKNVYITLNKNGQPNPCTENDKGKFDKVKAQNILNSLPKTMKRMGFKLECVPDVIVQTPIQKIVKEESKKIIENTDYHSPNWCSVSEMEECVEKVFKKENGEWSGDYIEWMALLGAMKGYEASGEYEVRAVFWFDN